MDIQRALLAVRAAVLPWVAAAFLICPVADATLASEARSSRCAELYARYARDDLAFPNESFDQTDAGGFRALARAGCDKEAAEIIESYLDTSGASDPSLRWHLARLKASAGETADAIRYARSVLVENEDDSPNALRWNDYVLATISFLEHDMDGLMAHRDRVAAAGDAYFGNVLNLALLDGLIDHFDRDYKYASTHLRR